MVCRLWPSGSPRLILLAGLSAFSLLSSEILVTLLRGIDPMNWFAVLGIESFLFVFYFLLFGTLIRSVSVTLLTRLLGMSDETIPFATLLDEYARSTRFEDRISVMHQARLVVLSGTSVVLTPKGRRLASIAESLAAVFSAGLEG